MTDEDVMELVEHYVKQSVDTLNKGMIGLHPLAGVYATLALAEAVVEVAHRLDEILARMEQRA